MMDRWPARGRCRSHGGRAGLGRGGRVGGGGGDARRGRRALHSRGAPPVPFAAAPRAREAAGPHPSAAERPARTGRDGSTRSSLRRTPRQSTSGGPATAGLPRVGPPGWERSAAPQWRSVPWRAAGARGKLRTLRGAPWRSWCAPSPLRRWHPTARAPAPHTAPPWLRCILRRQGRLGVGPCPRVTARRVTARRVTARRTLWPTPQVLRERAARRERPTARHVPPGRKRARDAMAGDASADPRPHLSAASEELAGDSGEEAGGEVRSF